MLTTISARISSFGDDWRADDDGGGFRLAGVAAALPPPRSAVVGVLCADPGRDIEDEDVKGLEWFVGEETLGVAMLLVLLFPLLYCPDRMAREFVPIMMIPGVARKVILQGMIR